MNKTAQKISAIVASMVFIASLSFAMNYLIARHKESSQQQNKAFLQQVIKNCAVI